MPPAELAVIERTMKQIDCPFKVARGTTLEEATASVRRLGRPPLSPTYRPQVFYHCACMGHWREVMDSHFKLFESVGLTEKIWGCVLGDGDDGQEAYRIADRYGIQFVNEQTFLIPSNGLDAYEVPTLCLIERWAQDNPQGVCLYAHTKGVSAPHDEIKQDWRRLMDACVIENWYANLRMIQDVDAIGVDWQDSTTDPHFSGNFWMAQADWIRGLMPIRDFRQSRAGTRHIMNHPWERMCAEMWLGSKPHISIISLACRNVNLWSEPNARKFLDVLAEKKPKMTEVFVSTPVDPDCELSAIVRRRMAMQGVHLTFRSRNVDSPEDVFLGWEQGAYYHALGNGDLVPTDFYARLGSPTDPVIAVSLETSPSEIMQLPVFACDKNRHAMKDSQFIVRGDVLEKWREIEPVYRPDLAVYHEAMLPGKWERIPI